MVRINVSYSPVSVTLFHDHEVIDHYTGDVSTWIYKLVQDSYDAGVKDAGKVEEVLPKPIHNEEIDNFVEKTLENVDLNLDDVDGLQMIDEGSPGAAD